MASVYSMDGDEITVGLQGCNVCDAAIRSACRIADQRGESVELHDDDGRWQVYPARASGKRRKASYLGAVSEVGE